MKQTWLIIGVWFLGLLCADAQTSNIDKMFPNAVISRANYDKAKADINSVGDNVFPRNWYLKQIKNPSDKIVSNNTQTTPVASINDNPNNVDITTEMTSILKLCLAYAFTQEESYLNKAVEYLKAWAAVNTAIAKKNINEESYNRGVEGYSIIRNVISEADRTIIDKWVRDRVNVFINSNDLRVNNWGTCMLYQFYLFGTTLGDEDVVSKFTSQYDTWAKGNLYPNGTTTDLLGRDAFAYHAYDLLFFARLCHLKALRDGYDAADEFYAKDVNWGASIKRSVDFWKPFMLDTKKYTHLEFVGTEYSPDKNRSDYNKAYNPSGTLYVVDEVYEMDKDLSNVLEHFSRDYSTTLKLGLSHLRWYK